jgi:hypothetical protein
MATSLYLTIALTFAGAVPAGYLLGAAQLWLRER